MKTRVDSAFTLTELLAALVIASMLLVILMGLIRRISQTNQTIKAKRPDYSWQTQLADTIQSDFESCRFVTTSPNQLVFDGYAIPKAIDFSSFQEIPAGHVLTHITYEILNRGESSWLIRTEDMVNRQHLDSKKTILMAQGIESIQLLDRLETNVAPAVLRLKMNGDSLPNRELQINLVRHGGELR